MSMNVNTTGTVYGSYQNTYKAGTVDKKKETAKTTENDKVKKNVTESIKCTLCQGHYDFSFSDFYFIFVCCVEASK